MKDRFSRKRPFDLAAATSASTTNGRRIDVTFGCGFRQLPAPSGSHRAGDDARWVPLRAPWVWLHW